MYHNNIFLRHFGIRMAMDSVVAQHIANRNANVVFEDRPWVPTSTFKKRYSIVNSFGAHGDNTMLLLEDASSQHTDRDESSSRQIVASNGVMCILAKRKASLRANVRALLSYLDSHKDTQLRDIAYTTCARRIHHHIRIATSVSSTVQLQSILQAVVDELVAHAKHVRTATEKTVMFAFFGQGCLYHGAAAQLFQRAPRFRDEVLQLDRIVRRLGFPSILATVASNAASIDSARFPQREFSSSSDDKADRDVVALSDESGANIPSKTSAVDNPLVNQLALVVIQIALVQYCELLGIKLIVVIGHSLGKYAALIAAGVLSIVALEVALSSDVVNDKTFWIDIEPHSISIFFASIHCGRATTQIFASLSRADDALSTLTESLAALHCWDSPSREMSISISTKASLACFTSTRINGTTRTTESNTRARPR